MKDFLNYAANIKKQAEIKAKLTDIEDEIDNVDDQLSISGSNILADILLNYRNILEMQRLDLERDYLELGLEINNFERKSYNAD